MTTRAPIELTEDQVLFFRARRGHLAGPGAPSAAAAARAIVGAQSQQLPPSLLALSMRMKRRPTAGALRKQLHGPDSKLVRTWGQRDTLFLYDPRDWALVVAARARWAPGGRGGPHPTEAMLRKARAAIARAGDLVTRTDLLGVAPKSYVRSISERAAAANLDAERLAAGRLLWRLAHRGEMCVADKVKNEQRYARREDWFPTLDWAAPDGTTAAVELVRRYLAAYGPATVQDVAHFFGARVAEARAWIAALEPELLPVACGDRTGLHTCAKDAATLKATPPTAASAWPVRLLPMWEAMLMAHADKSWTVPVEAERKMIWKKAAMVAPVVLARGRVVATWAQTARTRRLTVEVAPLSGWNEKRHAAGVRREARALADHLALDDVEVRL